MLTKRQNFLETIHGGNPDRFVNQFEAFHFLYSPIVVNNGGPRPGEPDKQGAFGVWFSCPEGQPAAYPVHTPDKLVLKDIEHWREYVTEFPKHDYTDEQWAPVVAEANAVDRNEEFVVSFVAPGIFEQCHHLMGVAECLTAFYEYPDEMHELIDYITEWELVEAKEQCDHLHPDAPFHHDDWGFYDSTFLRPEMFDEFFLPAYKKIYDYYRSRGVELIVHHSDSYAATLVPEMIEMGIDVWQGAMLSNDIPALIDQYGGQISFMGGLENSRIDVVEWSSEKIEDEVRRVCEMCGAHYFIPSLCAGDTSSVIPPVFDEATKAIERVNATDFSRILEATKAREAQA